MQEHFNRRQLTLIEISEDRRRLASPDHLSCRDLPYYHPSWATPVQLGLLIFRETGDLVAVEEEMIACVRMRQSTSLKLTPDSVTSRPSPARCAARRPSNRAVPFAGGPADAAPCGCFGRCA